MQTDEQRAEFQSAYQAWTALRQRHEDEMRAIVRGERAPGDDEHMFAQVDELNAAYKRFIDAGAPFIGFGPNLAR